jgi:hypothetical protein
MAASPHPNKQAQLFSPASQILLEQAFFKNRIPEQINFWHSENINTHD